MIQIAFCYRPAARDAFREYFGLDSDDLDFKDKDLPRRETVNDIIVVAFTRAPPALTARAAPAAAPEAAPAAADGSTFVDDPVAAQTEGLGVHLIPPPAIAIVPRAHPRQALCSDATVPPAVPPPSLPPAQVNPGFPPPVPATATSRGILIATTKTPVRGRVGIRETAGMDPSNIIESKLRRGRRDGVV